MPSLLQSIGALCTEENAVAAAKYVISALCGGFIKDWIDAKKKQKEKLSELVSSLGVEASQYWSTGGINETDEKVITKSFFKLVQTSLELNDRTRRSKAYEEFSELIGELFEVATGGTFGQSDRTSNTARVTECIEIVSRALKSIRRL